MHWLHMSYACGAWATTLQLRRILNCIMWAAHPITNAYAWIVQVAGLLRRIRIELCAGCIACNCDAFSIECAVQHGLLLRRILNWIKLCVFGIVCANVPVPGNGTTHSQLQHKAKRSPMATRICHGESALIDRYLRKFTTKPP